MSFTVITNILRSRIADSNQDQRQKNTLIHPKISNDVAEKMGAKSRRYLLLLDQKLSYNLPCPEASAISKFLRDNSDDERLLLYDLIEIADIMGTVTTIVHGLCS